MQSKIRKSKKGIQVELLILRFQDKNEVYYVYAPQLDLTGYGTTEEEADDSFNAVIGDFFDYSIKKKTLDSELRRLGWKKDKTTEYQLPASELPKERFNKIFDDYPGISSSRMPVQVPAFA